MTVLLNASVGVQRVLARLRPVQSRRAPVAESIHGQGLLLVAMMRRVASQAVRVPAATVAALRPPSRSRGRDIGTIERHSPTTNRRSGLAARYGVTIVNAPGTVDAGYRGEIKVILLNTDAEQPVRFRRGDRIAQLVIQRVERPVFRVVTSLPGSQRGEGGHGSTGGHAMTGDPSQGNEIPAGR